MPKAEPRPLEDTPGTPHAAPPAETPAAAAPEDSEMDKEKEKEKEGSRSAAPSHRATPAPGVTPAPAGGAGPSTLAPDFNEQAYEVGYSTALVQDLSYI